MRAYLVTRPKQRFATSFLTSPATIIVFVGFLALVLAPLPAEAATGTAFVRVNQMGYATAATKRAYLMASAPETGAMFSVKNGSTTVFGPVPIGANLGSWSSSYPDVYALDFDSFSTSGSYTITVSGPIASSSPSFRIDSAANVYALALSNGLSYYQNSRDGAPTIFPRRCALLQAI